MAETALQDRVRVLRQRLEADPGDEMAWYGLGSALLALESAPEAADALRRAVELRPDYSAAYRELGRALLTAGDEEGARDAFHRGLEASESSGDLQTGQEIRVFLRRLTRSADAASQEATANPSATREKQATARPEARTWYKKAFRHFVDDRLDEAIAGYRRAVEIDPELAIAWNGLAMALAQRGDLDGALQAGRRLVELEPDDPLGHTSLSMFYQRKGMIAEAEEERAIAMHLQLRRQQGL